MPCLSTYHLKIPPPLNRFLDVKDARYALLYSFTNFCNMLSILNELTLQEELQQSCRQKCVLYKKVKTQQLNKNSSIKLLPEPGIEPETSRTQVVCVTSGPSRQLGCHRNSRMHRLSISTNEKATDSAVITLGVFPFSVLLEKY